MADSTELADLPITIHRHVHAPPPLVISERNAESQGFSLRGWRKTCRAALAAGHAATETSDGWTMLRADVEAYLRDRATVARSQTPATATDDVATIAERAAAAAGFRMGGRR
jgi:hypothetical protein